MMRRHATKGLDGSCDLHAEHNNKERPGNKMKQRKWLAVSMALALGMGLATQGRSDSGSRSVASDHGQLSSEDAGGKGGAGGGPGGGGGKGGQGGGKGGKGGEGGGAGGKGGQGGGKGGGAGGKGG